VSFLRSIGDTATNTNHRASADLLGYPARLDKRARTFVPKLINAEWVSLNGQPWRLAWLSISGIAQLVDGSTGTTRRSVEWTSTDLEDAPWWARWWCGQYAPRELDPAAWERMFRSGLGGFAGEQCPTCDEIITIDGWCNCLCRGCGRPRLHNHCGGA
jgi:hypothetical protein